MNLLIHIYGHIFSSTGFGQGIRRSVFSIAAILGPLWAGGTVAIGNSYYVLLGVPCGLLVFITVRYTLWPLTAKFVVR